MSDTHVVLYDPEGRFDAELALDRALHKALVKAVLGWTVDPAVTTQTSTATVFVLMCGQFLVVCGRVVCSG
ncbi:hypothetical protein [Streptomyces griseus]|uniref:hypothetical protein n=1 Tax=Streptomyces griseus TaxID=1911 RepID=UPI00386EFCDB